MGYTELERMRFEQVERLLASSLTTRDWCRANKVAESTMYVWLRRYREQVGEDDSKRNGWIEVDRKTIHSKTALAISEPVAETDFLPAEPADLCSDLIVSCQDAQSQQFPSIRLHINGISVEVPHGVCGTDLAAVLKAAMSL